VVEALILWGVLSGNRDRWNQYLAENSDEETARDYILMFFFFLTIVLWPINVAVHLVRLALTVKIQYLSFLAIVPLLIGGLLLADQNYLVYAGVGLIVCMSEMIRVGVRAINV
jgi:hypothetical protein